MLYLEKLPHVLCPTLSSLHSLYLCYIIDLLQESIICNMFCFNFLCVHILNANDNYNHEHHSLQLHSFQCHAVCNTTIKFVTDK